MVHGQVLRLVLLCVCCSGVTSRSARLPSNPFEDFNVVPQIPAVEQVVVDGDKVPPQVLPDFTIRITEVALNEVIDRITHALLGSVASPSTIPLPDFNGRFKSESFSIFNINLLELDFSAYDMELSQVKVPHTEIDILPDNEGIRVSIVGIGVELSGRYRYEIDTFISNPGGGGSFDASTSNIDFFLKIHLGEEEGTPILTTSDCDLTIGELDVSFEGSTTSTFLNLFDSAIEKTAKKQASSQVCKQIDTVVDGEIAQKLANLRELEIPVGQLGVLAMNVSMPTTPVFTDTYLEIALDLD